MATKDEVENFLKQMREKMRVYEVVFRPRDKNLESLALLDILPIDRLDFLNGLTSANYYSGPNKDTNDTNKPDYYEFGITVKKREVYIKISLGLFNKDLDCMSFHIAEHPISYPLK